MYARTFGNCSTADLARNRIAVKFFGGKSDEDAIARSRIYPTVPPKVEYSLTDYGRSLKRALQAICDWGRIHMERINAVQVPPDRVAKAKPLGREA